MGFLAVAFVVLIIACAVFIGYSTITLLDGSARSLEHHLHAWSIALAATSLCVFLCGLLGLLYLWVVFAVLLATLMALAMATYRRTGRLQMKHTAMLWPRLSQLSFLELVFGVSILGFGVLALYPPVAWDAVMYHLPLAKHYAAIHAVAYDPFLRYSFAPQANEMLFTLVFLAHLPARTTQVIQFLIYVMVVIGTWVLSKRFTGSRQVAFLAAALMAGIPMVIFEGTTPYIDLWPLLFSLLGVISVSHIRSGSWSWRWAVLAGAYLGIGADAKYTGVVFAVAVAIYALVRWGVRNRGVYLLVASGLILMTPWYLRSTIITGNPVYPLLTGLFGNHGPWSNYQLAYQSRSLNATGATGIARIFGNLQAVRTEIYGGTEEGVLNIVPKYFWWAGMTGIFSYGFWKSRHIRLLMVIPIVYGLTWVSQSSVVRYGLEALPYVALLGGLGISGLVRTLGRWLAATTIRRHGKSFLRGVTSVLALLLLSAGLKYTSSFVLGNGLPPLSAKGANGYFSSRLPTYSLYQYLNQRFGSHYTVYGVFDERMTYFPNGVHIGDWFGPGSYFRVLGRQLGRDPNFSSARFHTRLIRLGVQYLVIPSSAYYLEKAPGFANYFSVLKTTSGGTLFKVLV